MKQLERIQYIVNCMRINQQKLEALISAGEIPGVMDTSELNYIKGSESILKAWVEELENALFLD